MAHFRYIYLWLMIAVVEMDYNKNYWGVPYRILSFHSLEREALETRLV